jgi:hypothetical protein
VLIEDVQNDVAKLRVVSRNSGRFVNGGDSVNEVFVVPVRFCRQLELLCSKIAEPFNLILDGQIKDGDVIDLVEVVEVVHH